MKKGNVAALLPIGVFLCIYLGLGIAFEYVMKIPMGFYNVPIIIAFLAAILVACLQNRKISFDGKLEIMAQGLADKNIITMLLNEGCITNELSVSSVYNITNLGALLFAKNLEDFHGLSNKAIRIIKYKGIR